MSPTNQEIIDLLFCIAPQFKTEDADKLACYNTIIDALRCQVNSGIVKCCTILAYVYLLAHLLTLQAAPTTGVASSISEGDLSISFAVTSDTTFLNSTSYGKAYQDLIKRTVFGGFNTNVPSYISPKGYYNGGCC